LELGWGREVVLLPDIDVEAIDRFGASDQCVVVYAILTVMTDWLLKVMVFLFGELRSFFLYLSIRPFITFRQPSFHRHDGLTQRRVGITLKLNSFKDYQQRSGVTKNKTEVFFLT